MRGQTPLAIGHDPGCLNNLFGRHVTFLLGKLGCEFGIEFLKRPLEILKSDAQIGTFGLKIGLPVNPAAHKITIIQIVLNQVIGNGQQNRGFRTGPGRQPMVRHRGRITQARIKGDDLGALALALDNALGVRVEIVPGFQMAADQ